MATIFDTLAFSRKLVDAGMEQRHAEAVAGAVHDAVGGAVVTQPMLDAALDKAKAELKLEIQQVRASLGITQWMVGAIVAGVASLVAKAFF